MTNVLILGAHGQIARLATPQLIAQPDVQLKLFLRRAARLANVETGAAEIIEGDAANSADLTRALSNVPSLQFKCNTL